MITIWIYRVIKYNMEIYDYILIRDRWYIIKCIIRCKRSIDEENILQRKVIREQ